MLSLRAKAEYRGLNMGVRWMILSFAVGGVVGAAVGFWRGWSACVDMRDLRERLRHARGRDR